MILRSGRPWRHRARRVDSPVGEAEGRLSAAGCVGSDGEINRGLIDSHRPSPRLRRSRPASLNLNSRLSPTYVLYRRVRFIRLKKNTRHLMAARGLNPNECRAGKVVTRSLTRAPAPSSCGLARRWRGRCRGRGPRRVVRGQASTPLAALCRALDYRVGLAQIYWVADLRRAVKFESTEPRRERVDKLLDGVLAPWVARGKPYA